jgi:hypothetical protein
MLQKATLPRLVCVRGGRKTNRATLAFFGNGLGGDRAGLHASEAGEGQECHGAEHVLIISLEFLLSPKPSNTHPNALHLALNCRVFL